MFRILLAAILLFCAIIKAANTNEFVNPPPAQTHFDLSGNPVYKLGDNVHLQWATNYKRANLVFRQLNATNGKAIASGSSFVKKNLNSSETSLDWKVISFNTNIDLSHVFYFMVVDTSTGGNNNESDASLITANNQTQFASHWFNITRNTASSSSGSGNKNQNGLGYPAKVGIGVGVGVGCAFLIALGVAIWYLRRRIKAIASRSQQGAEDSLAPAENDDASKPPASASEPATHEKDTDRQPAPLAEVHSNALVEMPAERGVELPSQQQEVRYELP